MRKLLLPWQIFWQSLTDAWSYPDLSKTGARTRLLTLLIWYFIFSIISTAHFAWHTLPDWRSKMTQTWELTKQHWPDKLVLIYDGQRLTTETPTQLQIPYPPLLPRQEGWPKWFARLNTEKIPQVYTDSLLFFTSDTVYTNAGAQQSAPLPELLGKQNWQVNKSTVLEADEAIHAFISDLEASLVVVRALVAWLPLLLIRLAGLLLYAWIAQTAYSLMGIRLSYKKMYSVGMITLLPAEAIQTIINTIYPENLPLFWWIWLAIVLLVGWSNRGRWSK